MNYKFLTNLCWLISILWIVGVILFPGKNYEHAILAAIMICVNFLLIIIIKLDEFHATQKD